MDDGGSVESRGAVARKVEAHGGSAIGEMRAARRGGGAGAGPARKGGARGGWRHVGEERCNLSSGGEVRVILGQRGEITAADLG